MHEIGGNYVTRETGMVVVVLVVVVVVVVVRSR